MKPTVGDCLLRRKNNFDFIRLVASIAVIYSHAFPLSDSGIEPLVEFSLNFSLGGLAVMTFFVISGFLITRSFSRSSSVKDYFVARGLRIYPALIVVIVLSAFILGPIFTTESQGNYFTHIRTYKYLTNIFALRIQNSLPGVFTSNPFPDFINGSLWSLPVEILCYLLVAVVGLFVRNKLKYAMILTSIVAVYLYFHPHHFNDDHYYPNIIFFAIGGGYYLLRDKIIMNYIGGLCMLALFIVSTRIPGGIAFVILGGISFTYLILYIGFIQNSPVENITKYGDFSYGLYIWAWPVQQVIALQRPDWNAYPSFFAAFGITLLLAILSWHLVEKRAMALKGRFKMRPQRTISAVPWPGKESSVDSGKVPIS